MDTTKLPMHRAGKRTAPIEGYLRELGLPQTAWFHAGTTDGCASFLATGTPSTGDAVMTLSSAIVLKLASDAPITAPQYGIYSHRVGGFWLVGGRRTAAEMSCALIGDDRLDDLTQMIDPAKARAGLLPPPPSGRAFSHQRPSLCAATHAAAGRRRPVFRTLFSKGYGNRKAWLPAVARTQVASIENLRTVGGGARNQPGAK